MLIKLYEKNNNPKDLEKIISIYTKEYLFLFLFLP